MSSVAGGIDGLEAVFDDASLVADGGLLLAGTVMHRLGLEALIDEVVRPGGSAGSGAGRKVLSLVASMLVGGRCIDDVQRLRSGSAAAVLPFAVVAPSTAGSFLRSFTFGHVRQTHRRTPAPTHRSRQVCSSQEVPPHVARITVVTNSILPCQEAFLVDAPTPSASPRRWIQAKRAGLREREVSLSCCQVFLGGLGQGLGLGFLVGGLGFEHGEDDVAAASGDADHGGVVAFAL